MDYELINREAFKVIGTRRITPYGGGTWEIIKSDGSGKAMAELFGHGCDLGLCFGYGADGSNDYMCAVEWEKEDISGFESFTYPPAKWLVLEAEGKISDQVLSKAWQKINNDILPQSNYRKSDLPTIEKYILWDDAADNCKVKIKIPVESK